MISSRHLGLVFALAAAGCGPSLQELSAKWIDCPADDIAIEGAERTDRHRSWMASCKGTTYTCEANDADSTCQSVAMASSGARPAKRPAAAAPARAWSPFDAKDCGMQVSLPGAPAEERTKTSAGGAELSVYQASVELNAPDAVVSIGCVALPSNVSPDKVLDGARNGMLRSMSGTLVSEEPLPAPQTGRDLRIAVSGDEVRSRIFALEGKIVTLTLAPSSAFSMAEADRFFHPTFAKAPAKP